MFLYPLCNYLQAKLNSNKAPVGPPATPLAVRGGQPDEDVVTNPHGRLTCQDNWQVFLDRAADAPIPKMCCRCHLNGKCVRSCHNSESHTPLTSEQKTVGLAWIASCRSRMRKPVSDGTIAAKKPKVVGPRDSYLVAAPSSPSPPAATHPSVALVAHTPPVSDSPSTKSPAARLHASRHAERDPTTTSPARTAPHIAPRLLAPHPSRNAAHGSPPVPPQLAPRSSTPRPPPHLTGKSPAFPLSCSHPTPPRRL